MLQSISKSKQVGTTKRLQEGKIGYLNIILMIVAIGVGIKACTYLDLKNQQMRNGGNNNSERGIQINQEIIQTHNTLQRIKAERKKIQNIFAHLKTGESIQLEVNGKLKEYKCPNQAGIYEIDNTGKYLNCY